MRRLNLPFKEALEDAELFAGFLEARYGKRRIRTDKTCEYGTCGRGQRDVNLLLDGKHIGRYHAESSIDGTELADYTGELPGIREGLINLHWEQSAGRTDPNRDIPFVANYLESL